MAEDRTETGRRRVTVVEAARILGTTAEGVRGRIKRGTLPSAKEGRTVYVLLDADQLETGRDRPTDQAQSDTTALISAKDETIATLREQLESERQAHAEARRIIAGLVERIPPAIEAPSEPPESPTAATPQPGRVEPQPAVQSTQAQESPDMAMPEVGGGPREEATGRPWWRFWA